VRLPSAIHGPLQQLVQPEQLPEITRKMSSQVLGAELCCCQLPANKEGFQLDPLDYQSSYGRSIRPCYPSQPELL
jgi:hypothetical protein